MEVSKNRKAIKAGIYLVIDPSLEESVLMEKLQTILPRKIAAVQIWDNFKPDRDIVEIIDKIYFLFAQHQIPVLINNQWELLKEIELDGVHFDAIPSNFNEIRKEIKKDLIFGLTCENDLADVKWAAEEGIDYISFCSMFPSSSAGDCEIVAHETVKEASRIFKNPLFLAGGIYPKNIKELDGLEYDGIAVISGIMNSENPDRAIDEYLENINFKK
ncbi:MAG: thiamine phosphate synthase [Aequorivita sp.]